MGKDPLGFFHPNSDRSLDDFARDMSRQVAARQKAHRRKVRRQRARKVAHLVGTAFLVAWYVLVALVILSFLTGPAGHVVPW